VNTSLLEQELAPLNAQIEQARKHCEALEAELHVVTTVLEKFSGDRQRFDALRDVCNAFGRLEELKASKLFWEGISEAKDAAGHLQSVMERVAHFDGKIGGVLEKQSSLQARIAEKRSEMDDLYEEVHDAHEREERRQEELVIEREISPVPYRTMIMPWTKQAESEKIFRRAVLVALLLCFFFGSVIPLVKVPIPDRSVAQVEIPERLAMLVKKEPPKPAPQPKPEPKKLDETKPAPEPEKPEKATKGGGEPAPEPKKVAGGGGSPGARKKAESVGVLAFKNTFKDLMKETPVARLGTEARLTKDSLQPAGQAVAHRSLVSMQGQGGTSGGISNFGVSRNVGSGGGGGGGGGYGIGMGGGYGSGDGTGSGFAKVKSAIAGRAEAPRPLSDGPGVGRTDEEIQIVFDRYKATLYRIYNTELRRDPTLRGKILLRISIESGGEVSLCKVESTDLGSPSLVAQIVERVKRFNFGSKEGVPKTTILYPIDFLPAG